MRAHKLDTAVDLWSVRVLSGYASRMRVRSFRLLVGVALLVLAPVVTAVTLFGLDLAATLLTEQPTGSAAHTGAVAGLGLVLALALCYSSVADLVRTHFSSAAYLISRSPLRGLWLATDLGLWRVVAAERGAALGSRALVQLGAVGGVALALGRAGHPAAADVAAIAVMLPVAYLAAAVALSVRHACADRRRGSSLVLLAVLGPLTLLTAFATARLSASGTVTTPGTTGTSAAATSAAATALASLGEQLGVARLVVLAFLVVGVAALTVVAAGDHDLPVTTHDTPPARSVPGSGLASAVVRGVGGPARMQVAVRATGVCVVAALGAAGWRLGGGPPLPEPWVEPVSRAMAFAAATLGMVVAAGTLLRVGQTSRLWHYRTLWEHGVSTRRLFGSAVYPSAVAAAVAAASLSLLVPLLTGAWSAVPALVLVAVVASEHLVDSLFARGVATPEARTTNTLLAVVGYLFTIPAILLGISLHAWSAPALAVLLVVNTVGGAWWFRKRLHSLPVTVVA